MNGQVEPTDQLSFEKADRSEKGGSPIITFEANINRRRKWGGRYGPGG